MCYNTSFANGHIATCEFKNERLSISMYLSSQDYTSTQLHAYRSLSHRQTAKRAALRWINAGASQWDLAVSWHVPQAMRIDQNGWDDHWLSMQLHHYLNKVDRRLFHAACRNRNVRLPRFITLERTDTVGWHAHGLISTPAGMDQSDVAQTLAQQWHHHTRAYPAGKFDGHLFWCEPNEGHQASYILKNAIEPKDAYSGIIDARNIYFL